MESIERLNIDRMECSLTRLTSYPDHSSTKPSTKVLPEQVWPTVIKIFPGLLFLRDRGANVVISKGLRSNVLLFK